MMTHERRVRARGADHSSDTPRSPDADVDDRGTRGAGGAGTLRR